MATSAAQPTSSSNEENPQLPPRPDDSATTITTHPHVTETASDLPQQPGPGEESLSPEVAALKSMFPDFDAAVL